MIDQHRQRQDAEPLPAALFDLWLTPFVFWANWCSLCEQALHVTHIRLCPAGRSGPVDRESVDIEVEEGLVA